MIILTCDSIFINNLYFLLCVHAAINSSIRDMFSISCLNIYHISSSVFSSVWMTLSSFPPIFNIENNSRSLCPQLFVDYYSLNSDNIMKARKRIIYINRKEKQDKCMLVCVWIKTNNWNQLRRFENCKLNHCYSYSYSSTSHREGWVYKKRTWLMHSLVTD